jgi:hypothetical protein
MSEPRVRLRALGLLSLALFWMPLLAPLIQVTTLADLALARRRGPVDRLSLLIAGGGALAGMALFLALQYVWVI